MGYPCLRSQIMMNRVRLWNQTGRAWYMASIAARNSVVELGLLPDHLRHGQPQVTPSAGTLSRPSAGTGPAHGRACAHAQRHPCVCHSQGERTTNVVSHARTRCGEGGCLSPRQGPHTLKPSAFHSPWTAHLRPRASGSFMTSIMTRFFTAGSAIMSESSCGARALPVSAARCMEQHGRLANLRPAQPHALHTVRSDRCCCASLYHKRLCQTSEGAMGDRRACRPAAWAGARRACAHSAVHWPWFW